MEKIEVYIGSVVTMNNGRTQDAQRLVVFEGEELGRLTTYYDEDPRRADTRGTTQTLYKTADGRLVVHTNNWSRWQGEPNVATLQAVTEADLQLGGEFEALGHESGFGRPYTLDEALKISAGEDLDS